MPVQSAIPTSTPARKKTFWQRAVRQPQQLWIRKAMFQIHLWTGIIVGLYIIAIGISGSILVFKEELMPRPSVSVPTVDLRDCTPEKLVSVVDRVRQVYPEKDAFLTACPQEANPLYLTTIRDKPVAKTAILGGLHHEYRLEKLATYRPTAQPEYFRRTAGLATPLSTKCVLISAFVPLPASRLSNVDVITTTTVAGTLTKFSFHH